MSEIFRVKCSELVQLLQNRPIQEILHNCFYSKNKGRRWASICKKIKNQLFACQMCDIKVQGLDLKKHLGGIKHIQNCAKKDFKISGRHFTTRMEILTPIVKGSERKREPKENIQQIEPQQNIEHVQSAPSGFIGVGYIIKVIKSDNSVSLYECALCAMQLDGIALEKHICGYNHRLNYCNKHFPSGMEKFYQHVKVLPIAQQERAMTAILHRFANNIEQHHGRPDPITCLEGDYPLKRNDLIMQACSYDHPSELNGPRYSLTVSASDIQKILNIVGGKSHSSFLQREKADDKKLAPPPPAKQRNRSRSPFKSSNDNIHQNAKRSNRSFNSPDRSSPGDQHYTANSIRYHRELKQRLGKLNEIYNEYRSDPEKHPLYKQEWSKFWRVTKNDLDAQGLNTNGYNYQPEWELFFSKRLGVLFNEEMKKIKSECSQEFFSSDSSERQMINFKGPAGLSFSQQRDARSISNNITIDDILSVLRLLSALEDLLGRLGPKIINMLTKTLQTEKINPNELGDIITIENCSLLETAKEKFKGLVMTGVLDVPKENIVQRAIKEINEFLMKTETFLMPPAPVREPRSLGVNQKNSIKSSRSDNGNLNRSSGPSYNGQSYFPSRNPISQQIQNTDFTNNSNQNWDNDQQSDWNSNHNSQMEFNKPSRGMTTDFSHNYNQSWNSPSESNWNSNRNLQMEFNNPISRQMQNTNFSNNSDQNWDYNPQSDWNSNGNGFGNDFTPGNNNNFQFDNNAGLLKSIFNQQNYPNPPLGNSNSYSQFDQDNFNQQQNNWNDYSQGFPSHHSNY